MRPPDEVEDPQGGRPGAGAEEERTHTLYVVLSVILSNIIECVLSKSRVTKLGRFHPGHWNASGLRDARPGRRRAPGARRGKGKG